MKSSNGLGLLVPKRVKGKSQLRVWCDEEKRLLGRVCNRIGGVSSKSKTVRGILLLFAIEINNRAGGLVWSAKNRWEEGKGNK